MKRLCGFVICISLIMSGIYAAAAGEKAEILSLIKANPVTAEKEETGSSGGGDIHSTSQQLNSGEVTDEVRLKAIKRVSGLYEVSGKIAALSNEMSMSEYNAVRNDVNSYIEAVETADAELDVDGLMKTAEYRELLSGRAALNEMIDTQPPQITSVESIHPNGDFWVEVQVMYKSSDSREFSLVFCNNSAGIEVANVTGTILPGTYTSRVKLRADGCGTGDIVTINVAYKGVEYSDADGCMFRGKVTADTDATEAPTAEPTKEPVEKKNEDSSDNEEVKSFVEASSGTSSWSNKEVTAAIELGLVPQKLQGGYKEYITREGFCELAARAVETYSGISITKYAELYGSNEASFTDTTDSEIAACAVLGIVNGFEDGSFRPDYAITREQAAAMLARCAKKLELSDKPGIFIFEDNESISGWARGHVRYVRANEIMNGDDNNCFMPHVCYTVEQAILTFYRMYIKCV